MKKRITCLAFISLALVCILLFAACTPASTPEKAKENLENNDYSVLTAGGTIPALFGIKNVSKTVIGTYSTEDNFEFVTILYFETSQDAKDAVEKAKEYAKESEKDKEEEMKKEKSESDWTFGRKGNMIWFGTKTGVKAAS